MYYSEKQKWSSRRNLTIGRIAGLSSNVSNLLLQDSQSGGEQLTPAERVCLARISRELTSLSRMMYIATFEEFHKLVKAQEVFIHAS